MNPEEEYYKHRLNVIADGGNDAKYPNDFKPSISFPLFISTWSYLENGDTDEVLVQVAARVVNKREASKALIFFDVTGDTATENHLQVLLSMKGYEGEQHYQCLPYAEIKKTINRGDIIGVIGLPHRSKRGELSVLCKGIRLLAPCLRELPRNLEDQQSLRVLQYIANPQLKNVIYLRAAVLKFIRSFLDDNEFTEVETPMLEYGTGANAKPFTTYYEALKCQVNLRVAPELYLKMLVMADVGRVYEIGKQFRNEGMDSTHRPEFTSCEFYYPHATMLDLIPTTEALLSGLYDKLQTHVAMNCDVDWTPPYRRIDIVPALEDICHTHIDLTLSQEELAAKLTTLIHEKQLTMPDEKNSVPKLFDTLISGLLEPLCHNPTFLINHPAVMCPLAKNYTSDSTEGSLISQRFELFVKGKELCNAYSELNNPVLQREKLRKQEEAKALGDSETITVDEAYCQSMEYGFCPTAGWGIGLDRLLMLLTSSEHIRDVITFSLSKSAK